MGFTAYSPRRGTACALLVAGALAAAAACSPAGRAGTGATTPAPATPAEVCTSLVAYWAEEALKGSTWAGLDWEQKGLSNEQLALHDEVLTEARAEEKRNGRTAAVALVRREAGKRCKAQNGATGSSENWDLPR
ncbi:hypothetical protein [Streptomyces sp. NPDC059828]|uniref:hypothetical protein n=1 Tax=Streptomyces sp. NPDC059828 TaxID=3346965 RepID=UPI00364D7E32